eukprot:UN01502
MVPPSSSMISRATPYSHMFNILPLQGYHSLWLVFPNYSSYSLNI